jgi:hypothetical protein
MPRSEGAVNLGVIDVAVKSIEPWAWLQAFRHPPSARQARFIRRGGSASFGPAGPFHIGAAGTFRVGAAGLRSPAWAGQVVGMIGRLWKRSR